ncbi:hypothetical protein AJ79_06784 [Helicocarpus griseus UAMH5409]|uniref:6-phosphogluconate dehydrogenase NADP-binding domain-containing protein n=1 Tax=Helicocarpus griseus UAMH5409 TaxID=1447875 RepID=A0A2B7X9U6_9EURO|nr:hypothetical protein AJ79_06784 [Helicocarpus griseus UAMH5409]
MASKPLTIAFIGLGTMGLPTAANIVNRFRKAKLYVFDIVKEAHDKLKERQPGAGRYLQHRKGCGGECSKSSHLDVLQHPGSESRKPCPFRFPHAFHGARRNRLSGKLIIECSTIDTRKFLEVDEQLKSKYPTAALYDAPVSGGSLGAEKGSLIFMVGASDEDPKPTPHPV